MKTYHSKVDNILIFPYVYVMNSIFPFDSLRMSVKSPVIFLVFCLFVCFDIFIYFCLNEVFNLALNIQTQLLSVTC